MIVAMCKKLYMSEMDKEMQSQETFEDVAETEAEILTRHREFQLARGLETNERLPYPYGIWKRAKRKLRIISGVKKTREDKQRGLKEKPQGSIAGVGTELVKVLNQVMETLKKKDVEGTDRGEPKKVWFVTSVEEVVQPIRFKAEALGHWEQTADTVDFITMYPKFDQQLLQQRLTEALLEAWRYAEEEEGETLRLTRKGWVQDTGAAHQEGWTQPELIELVSFVINNGYLKWGSRIKRQVKGFGMGLQCAPQFANLACYIPERDYAGTCAPEEVEDNYRFIDDILTFSGKIPTTVQYGMDYKSTKKQSGEVEYLGMRVVWSRGKDDKCKVATELLQREAAYPIRIIRYPAQDSLASDEQRMGVVMGQFIRAQRICSHLAGFKAAVLYVVKCAFRRGYPRRRLHEVWGRFLGQWWAAREMRRGQLRAWFKRMTKYAKQDVRREDEAMAKPTRHPSWRARPPEQGPKPPATGESRPQPREENHEPMDRGARAPGRARGERVDQRPTEEETEPQSTTGSAESEEARIPKSQPERGLGQGSNEESAAGHKVEVSQKEEGASESGIPPQRPEEREANKEQSHQHRRKAAPNPCQEATGEVTQRKQQLSEEEQEEEPSSQDPLSLLREIGQMGETLCGKVKLPKRWWETIQRPPDGHCLYHCLLGKVDHEEMRVLRVRIASWLEANLDQVGADGGIP